MRRGFTKRKRGGCKPAGFAAVCVLAACVLAVCLLASCGKNDPAKNSDVNPAATTTTVTPAQEPTQELTPTQEPTGEPTPTQKPTPTIGEKEAEANAKREARAGKTVIYGPNRAPDEPYITDYVNWNNKMLIWDLHDIVSECADDDLLAIGYFNPNFVYDGKTAREYEAAYLLESKIPELMELLLKEGEYLKYGAALYETGTPDGERWTRELYEERVAMYGDLIERYIVDGELMREQLAKDIETAKELYTRGEAYFAYENATVAYHAELAERLRKERGVDAEFNGRALVMYMTREEFAIFRMNPGREGLDEGAYTDVKAPEK
ncbi:MAG: hypothetical protein IKX54_02355 [Lachnospiraceae bacterium]|nr:hypothetical protein [Lachnospiraceae bacterium]